MNASLKCGSVACVSSIFLLGCQECHRSGAVGEAQLQCSGTQPAVRDHKVVAMWFGQLENIFDHGTGRKSIFGFLADIEPASLEVDNQLPWNPSSRIMVLFRSRREAIDICSKQGYDPLSIPWCRLTYEQGRWLYTYQPFPDGSDMEQGIGDGPFVADEFRGFGPVMMTYKLPNLGDRHVAVAASCGYGNARQTLASTDSFTSLVCGEQDVKHIIENRKVQKLDWTCFEWIEGKWMPVYDAERCP